MSVVQVDRRRRWLVVALGTAALAGVPASWSAARGAVAATAAGPDDGSVPEFLRRTLASARVGHTGLTESRGGAFVPDLPRLGQLGSLIGGTVHARVWWASTRRWRVDTLTTTGERDTYATGAELVTWDYEGNDLAVETPAPGLRLPRADDLLPPQLARRLLAAVGGADQVRLRPGTGSVAGRPARGLTVVPGDPRATVTSLDVWADRGTALPLSVTLRGSGGAPALSSRFLDVSLAPPADDVLVPPSAPSARRRTARTPDVIRDVREAGGWHLPYRVAGFPRWQEGDADGYALYGRGLARFVVLPMPQVLGAQLLDAARSGGARVRVSASGEVAELPGGLLNTVAARTADAERTYLASGLVRTDVLRAAVGELLARPPGRRA